MTLLGEEELSWAQALPGCRAAEELLQGARPAELAGACREKEPALELSAGAQDTLRVSPGAGSTGREMESWQCREGQEATRAEGGAMLDEEEEEEGGGASCRAAEAGQPSTEPGTAQPPGLLRQERAGGLRVAEGLTLGVAVLEGVAAAEGV